MENSEPYIQKAVVNGLIATVILWGFWTPFILLLVVKLVNNQIKDGICYAAQYTGNEKDTILVYAASDIADYSKLPYSQVYTFLEKLFGSKESPTAEAAISDDPSVISETNMNLSIIMLVTCITVIVLSIGIAYYIIQTYNLDGWYIFKFNIVMAVIIMTIEAVFFGGVAMKFIPFYPPTILQNLGDKIDEYVKAMTGA
jgi:hypothetical protein